MAMLAELVILVEMAMLAELVILVEMAMSTEMGISVEMTISTIMAISPKMYEIHRDYGITINFEEITKILKIDADALISLGGGGPVPGSADIQHNRIQM